MCLMNQSLGMHGTNVTPGMTAAMTRNEHISALLALQFLFHVFRVDDMFNYVKCCLGLPRNSLLPGRFPLLGVWISF